MKTFYRATFIAPLVLVSILLTACGSSSDSASTPQAENNTNSTVTTIEEEAPSSPSAVTEEQVLADSDLAIKYFNEANLEGCGKISLENFKNQCRYNIITSMAVKRANPDLCNELSDPVEVDSCKVRAELKE